MERRHAQRRKLKKRERIAAEGVVVTLRGEPVLVANRYKQNDNVVNVQRMLQAQQHMKKQQQGS